MLGKPECMMELTEVIQSSGVRYQVGSGLGRKEQVMKTGSHYHSHRDPFVEF